MTWDTVNKRHSYHSETFFDPQTIDLKDLYDLIDRKVAHNAAATVRWSYFRTRKHTLIAGVGPTLEHANIHSLIL